MSDRGCICQGCQNHYRVDLYVDDALWKQVSDGANLLCPWCILESVALTRDFAAFAMVDVDELTGLRSRLAECEAAVDQCVALAEYIETAAKGAMVERIRTALSTSFAQERAAELAALRRDAERLEWLVAAGGLVVKTRFGYDVEYETAHHVCCGDTPRQAIDRARGVK